MFSSREGGHGAVHGRERWAQWKSESKDCVCPSFRFHTQRDGSDGGEQLPERPNPVEIGLIKAYQRHIQDHGSSDVKIVPFNA